MKRAEKYDLTGKRFGMAVVQHRVNGVGRPGVVYWKVRCDCGSTNLVEGPNLRKGNTRSCGCMRTLKAKARPRDERNQRWIKVN